MTAANARKAMESIKYLISSKATKDAVERLKYWRSNPSLRNGIRRGNVMATTGDCMEQLNGFYMTHQSLGRGDVELQLLKRLKYISLWSTVLTMCEEFGEGDNKMLKQAKVHDDDMGDSDDRRSSGWRMMPK